MVYHLMMDLVTIPLFKEYPSEAACVEDLGRMFGEDFVEVDTDQVSVYLPPDHSSINCSVADDNPPLEDGRVLVITYMP